MTRYRADAPVRQSPAGRDEQNAPTTDSDPVQEADTGVPPPAIGQPLVEVRAVSLGEGLAHGASA